MNARAHGQRRHRREQDRVAVGSGARRRLRRDDGAAARTILHHDRPLELVLQLLRQDAREDVGAAAGGERTEEGHRALGIAVSRRLRGRRVEGEAAGEREHDGSFHALPGNGNALRAGREIEAGVGRRCYRRRSTESERICGDQASSVVTSRRIYPHRRDMPHSRAIIRMAVYVLAPLARRLEC